MWFSRATCAHFTLPALALYSCFTAFPILRVEVVKANSHRFIWEVKSRQQSSSGMISENHSRFLLKLCFLLKTKHPRRLKIYVIMNFSCFGPKNVFIAWRRHKFRQIWRQIWIWRRIWRQIWNTLRIEWKNQH